MNIYFYLYGIVYILHHIKKIYDVTCFDYKKDVVEKINEIIPDEYTEENVIKYKNKSIDSIKKSALETISLFITGILNWAWIILGALYAIEVNSFGILFIASALSSLIALIYAVNIVIKNGRKFLSNTAENPRAGLLLITDEAHNKTISKKTWNVIDSLIRISISISILYQHFI